MAELNLAQIHEAIAAAIPQRECIVYRDRRLTYGDVTTRTRRLANYLLRRGLGLHTDRAQLANHESGQDHVGLYLYNGNEYLEAMLGAFKARCVPVNVNYRYVESELVYLLSDAAVRALIYHASFAPVVAAVREHLPRLEVLIQVDDGQVDDGPPSRALLPGAVDYEAALAESSPQRPALSWSPDDLYILYTGGSTGMPKGVLWRQADVFMAALGGRSFTGEVYDSVDALTARVQDPGGLRVVPAPPMMHGAGHWSSFIAWHSGGTVIIQDNPRRYDPADILRTAEREQANNLVLIGDAFGRPLIEELKRNKYDLPKLEIIANTGAPMSPKVKRRLLEQLPQSFLFDVMGSSESGQQGSFLSGGGAVSSGTFSLSSGACVLDDSMTRVLEPGCDELGWLAQRSPVPLGYLGDAEKTRRTFPVIGGERFSVPGDRARLTPDGRVHVLGRDSQVINSGGEKIFAEEVEIAVKRHSDVSDVIVCGRPNERWGEEVCAIVQLRRGARVTEAELRETCAQNLARYKLPKAFVFRDRVQRSPAGKADYRWARQQLAPDKDDKPDGGQTQ